jgi:hypothetical protein
MIWDAQIRIPDLDFFSISTPDPEVKKHRIPDPQHCQKFKKNVLFKNFTITNLSGLHFQVR